MYIYILSHKVTNIKGTRTAICMFCAKLVTVQHQNKDDQNSCWNLWKGKDKLKNSLAAVDFKGI